MLSVMYLHVNDYFALSLHVNQHLQTITRTKLELWPKVLSVKSGRIFGHDCRVLNRRSIVTEKTQHTSAIGRM